MPRPSPLAKLGATKNLNYSTGAYLVPPTHGLLEVPHYRLSTCPSLSSRLDISAVATVASCTDFGSSNYQQSVYSKSCHASAPCTKCLKPPDIEKEAQGVLATPRKNLRKSRRMNGSQYNSDQVTFCETASKMFRNIIESVGSLFPLEISLKTCNPSICSWDFGCSALPELHPVIEKNAYRSEMFDARCPFPLPGYYSIHPLGQHHTRENVQSKIYQMNKDVNDNISTFGPESSYGSNPDEDVPSKTFYEAYMNYQIRWRHEHDNGVLLPKSQKASKDWLL